MMRGDAFVLPIKIETDDGIATANNFSEVEVCIGNAIRKTMSSGEITYDAENARFLVPLTQEETFSLSCRTRINVRCKYENGNVIGRDLGVFEFAPTLSNEVL